ncbi:uracil-DNA glycosylase [Falsiporphyromonas endometrii]|uniref:Uracil-DNA glycosylase n=1 Tax=Falsiporphyromonas endometrii TaxID=1387297 RepID=A0ABV9KA32_9PORP
MNPDLVRIEAGWKEALKDEFSKLYFDILTNFIREEYAGPTPIYPPAKLIFRAFDECPFDKVKVVILGQDPYHEAGQAEGLSFSVPDNCPIPPSLRNIYQEIFSDLGRPSVMKTGHLIDWARQGVLLLNATLTVKAKEAGSHQNKGWETFTDAAIQKLASERSGIVFLLWGAYAGKKAAMIDPKKHLILKAPHPSPLAAYRGFFGCKHFSKANEYLISQGKEPINW